MPEDVKPPAFDRSKAEALVSALRYVDLCDSGGSFDRGMSELLWEIAQWVADGKLTLRLSESRRPVDPNALSALNTPVGASPRSASELDDDDDGDIDYDDSEDDDSEDDDDDDPDNPDPDDE